MDAKTAQEEAEGQGHPTALGGGHCLDACAFGGVGVGIGIGIGVVDDDLGLLDVGGRLCGCGGQGLGLLELYGGFGQGNAAEQ